ncbi:MAG: phosphomannomutase/phosphoglucomutase [Anaerolineae bacterium]|jgi:phosphomannomutase/phosphoglucomutase|nr:phosphomannomutase/phosphoglucomutase [Anaerolineae bacterium]
MAAISSGIFKKYDIRGTASGDNPALSPAIAATLGQAIGTYLQQQEQQQRVIVGHDNRHSSPALHAALLAGLARSGCQVLDIGLVSTPVVYWHAVQQGHCGAVMVTGSHLAPHYNGFKISVGARNIYDAGLQAIARLIAADALLTGPGRIDSMADARQPYLDDLSRRVQIGRRLKVVIDPGNGTGGLFAPALLERLGQEVSGIFTEPDGSYPNHQPDPSDEKNLHALGAAVRAAGADIGIAFDGDADRVGAVDEQGQPIVADRLVALLAQDLLRRQPGAVVIGDVLCSQVLFDTIRRAGGVPVMAPSGHSIVKDAMREHGALLGGEQSGHIFLGEDYYGFDDGYLVAARLLQLLAGAGAPLSALDAGLGRLYSTPEYRPHCPDADKATVIAGVRAALEHTGQVTAVDGIRVQFEQGWGLLRASNTEPVLSLRFEATTEAAALAYRERFVQALAQYPQVEALI